MMKFKTKLMDTVSVPQFIPQMQIGKSHLSLVCTHENGALITKEDLITEKITDTELLNLALNTIHDQKPVFMPLEMKLNELVGQANGAEYADDMTAPFGETGVYMLTTEQMENGANILTNNKILSEIQDKIGAYYIIPSSVHEVLILPKSQYSDGKELEDMLRTVNRDVVSEQDRLSDNLLEYDGVLKTWDNVQTKSDSFIDRLPTRSK